MSNDSADGFGAGILPVEMPTNHRLTIRGRTYPFDLYSDRQEPSIDLDADRNREIAASLWSTLPLANLEGIGATDKTALVKIYEASLRVLYGYRSEVESLFRTMCEIHLEFHHEEPLPEDSKQTVIAAKLEEMLEKSRFVGVPLDSTLRAELVERPLETMFEELQRSLRKSTDGFVESIFKALDRLVDKEGVGAIEWVGETTCRFHFFKESIIHSYTGERTEYGQPKERYISPGHIVETSQEISKIKTGRHVHYHVRHEHHVMNAEKNTLHAPFPDATPVAARRLIAAIPVWLEHRVSIVSGLQILERMIAREVGSEEHEETQVTTETVRVYADPAVTLDHYVLTGWGQREIEDETARRDGNRQQQAQQKQADEQMKQQSTRDRRRSASLAGQRFRETAAIAALLEIAALFLVLLGIIKTPGLILFGAAVCLAGLLPVVRALGQLARSRGLSADWKFLTTGSLSVLAGCLGLQFVLAGSILGAVPLVVVGLGQMVVAVALAHTTRQLMTHVSAGKI